MMMFGTIPAAFSWSVSAHKPKQTAVPDCIAFGEPAMTHVTALVVHGKVFHTMNAHTLTTALSALMNRSELRLTFSWPSCCSSSAVVAHMYSWRY